ncbi:MAG TPA: metalloregulator ArsR/SmtB family transcription factor [Candidatus Norongarragalinales archaeon]|nr:metalloregulator ArsR/SmtB family transcription factor [Candidatus Norongarragalinales archaeon]
MNRIYQLHAEMCKTFANPIRLEILDLLRDRESTVTELVKKTQYSQVNISQHLSVMRGKGIVVSERRGKNVYYRLSTRKITKAFDIIREILNERLKNDKNWVSA